MSKLTVVSECHYFPVPNNLQTGPLAVPLLRYLVPVPVPGTGGTTVWAKRITITKKDGQMKLHQLLYIVVF